MNALLCKTAVLTFIFLFVHVHPFAMPPAGLDKELLDILEQSLTLDASEKATMNALTNNDLDNLVLNRQLVSQYNDVFNVMTGASGITDQKSTGRCWMFSALNTLRPAILKKYQLSEFELSQTYLFFWDKLEKSNFFLESIIETRDKSTDDRELRSLLDGPVADGGWWNYVVSLIEKYGVVPKDIMPETHNSENSKYLNKITEYLALQFAAELRHLAGQGKNLSQLRERKTEMLKVIYRILVMNLGIPPQKFTWRYQDKEKNLHEGVYTPLSYYQEVVGVDLQEYVTLFNYPGRPFDAYFQVNYRRNMFDKPDMDFINLDIDKLKEYTLASLLDDRPVWFAADVGWQMERKIGIMADGIYDYESLLNYQDDMNKADRIQYGATSANHAMTFIGADTTEGKVVQWRVENSWGTDLGDKGYWTMHDNWFDKYVFTIIIHRKYLPPAVVAILNTRPVILPTWDPLAVSLRKM